MWKVLVVSILIIAGTVHGCIKLNEKCGCPMPNPVNLSAAIARFGENIRPSDDEVQCSFDPDNCSSGLNCTCRSGFYAMTTLSGTAFSLKITENAKCNETTNKWYYRFQVFGITYITGCGCFIRT